jgi:hypothetical protein
LRYRRSYIFVPEHANIHKAIDWAISVCHADIVTMSFGLPIRSKKIKKAIDAYGGEKIFFGATHNDGANRSIAYPARHSKVIGINSTDGNGNRSGFNPSPQKGKENFSTLGEAIKSEWPDSSGLRCEVRKSGTSYATPIAAAIAATFLDYARLKLALDEEDIERLYSCEGMKLMLKLMSDERTDGYSYVAPWLLWENREDVQIHGLILEELAKLD